RAEADVFSQHDHRDFRLLERREADKPCVILALLAHSGRRGHLRRPGFARDLKTLDLRPRAGPAFIHHAPHPLLHFFGDFGIYLDHDLIALVVAQFTLLIPETIYPRHDFQQQVRGVHLAVLAEGRDVTHQLKRGDAEDALAD